MKFGRLLCFTSSLVKQVDDGRKSERNVGEF
jgi:hypothetical protein